MVPSVLIILLVSLPCSDSAKKLINIDYLGRGYDAFKGNPHSSSIDPGFKDPVIQLTYSGKQSADGAWLLPDMVFAVQTPICSYDAQVNEIFGAKSYQNSLRVDASVGGSGFGAEFSASVGYSKVQSGASDYHNVFVEAVAKCLNYKANTLGGITLADSFASKVQQLPDTPSPQYNDLIKTYGTHYLHEVTMGAKAIVESEFDQMSWSKFKKTGYSITASAQASYAGMTGSTSSSTSQDQAAKEAFEEIRSSYSAIYVGSKPSADGKWETWAASTGASPFPISYAVSPLAGLLTTTSFPGISPESLAAKKRLLTEATRTYCRSLNECKPPQDSFPVSMNVHTAHIIGNQVVSCNLGYKLVSCGLDNVVGSSKEVFRTYVPVSDKRCRCYDYYGAKCVVACSNAVKGFQIVKSSVSATPSVSCPAGKKVLGCHIETAGRKWEKFRHHHPSDNGQRCHCYDYFGAKCIATCASNIYDYEVRKQSGKGTFRVRCSIGNFALGCGIVPSGKGVEVYMKVFVKSIDSCECYNYFGATCYATCGKFKT